MAFNSVGTVESLIQATLFYLFMDVELIMSIFCGGIKFLIMTFLHHTQRRTRVGRIPLD